MSAGGAQRCLLPNVSAILPVSQLRRSAGACVNDLPDLEKVRLLRWSHGSEDVSAAQVGSSARFIVLVVLVSFGLHPFAIHFAEPLPISTSLGSRRRLPVRGLTTGKLEACAAGFALLFAQKKTGRASFHKQAESLGNRSYLPKSFFTSPTLRCTLPPTFLAVPLSRRFRLATALPAVSFTLPAVSRARSLTLSSCSISYFVAHWGDCEAVSIAAGLSNRRSKKAPSALSLCWA